MCNNNVNLLNILNETYSMTYEKAITLYKLDIEAMHFFEVLTLSLETGRNLSEAIEVTTSNDVFSFANAIKNGCAIITVSIPMLSSFFKYLQACSRARKNLYSIS